MSDILTQLKELVEYVETLQEKIGYARSHLRPYLKEMDVDNLQCLLMDDLFSVEEYPPEALRCIAEKGDVYKDKARMLLMGELAHARGEES